jgi:CheY-like chemotaxis protein
VTSTTPDWLRGDPGRIKQILLNLVGNAIKFTDEGEVTLQVGLAGPAPVEGTARLRFAIRDTGVGIPAEDHGKLFQAFRQVDAAATRRHGGTGLGLAISKQLVDLMGGVIGCESRPGQGSTFWFELPLALAPPPVLDLATPGGKQRTRFAARVLVAEDNPVNSEVATIMLEELGITVVRAEDGRQALANAQADNFDLILMDCQMPEMDGFEATRRIIAHERTQDLPHTPIVALTGNAIRGDREACLEAGMDDYLAKPFEFDDLVAILDRWLPNADSTGHG